MAMSGSFDWTLTRAQVIAGALRKLGVLPSGGTPSSAQTNDASEALNALIKAFHADGMPLWAITSTTFTVTSGTSSYTIGPSKTVNVAAAPLKVLQAYRTPSGESDVPMNLYTRYDFSLLPTLSTITGMPVNLYYHPIVTTGVAEGIIYLWPVPDDSTTTITIDYQRPFADMDATDNNFDFPAYWMQALIYNLAWSLAPEYGIPPTDRGLLAKEAQYWKQEALSYGTEEGSITFIPSNQG
jgi:hypothetical protein